MNKKLLAAALGVAFAAPVFADSSNLIIYGRVHQQLDHRSTDNGNGAETGGNFTVRDVSSRLGFKGSEDLGGGLSAIFGYEFAVASDSNTGINGGRNSVLGLKGNFGKVVVGKQDGGGYSESPLYTQASMIGSVSNNGGTLTTVGGAGTTVSAGNAIVRTQRVDNAVSYANKFGGLNVAARHALRGDNNQYNNGATTVKENGRRETEIAVDYSIGALKIGGGLQYFDQQGQDPTTASPENLVQLVAQYKLASLTLTGLIAQTNLYAPVAAGRDDSNMDGAISAMYKLSGNSGLFAMYATTERNDLATQSDVDQWQIAAYYDFSKRTRTYVGFNRLTLDPQGGSETDTDNFTVGLRHNF